MIQILCGIPNPREALLVLGSSYGLATRKRSMATWWVAVFRDGERLQVCTESSLKFEAWQKVSRMFPGRELVSINAEEEEGEALEAWGMRS